MDRQTAIILLNGLIERLEADLQAKDPTFMRVVSTAEREAVRFAIKSLSTPASEENKSGQPELRHSEEANIDLPANHEATATPTPPTFPVCLSSRALTLNAPEEPGYVLCIDFGTAKSKAMAASTENRELVELALGKRDNDLDGSVYAMNSSVWVEENGLIFAGTEAVRRGILRSQSGGDHKRRRLDSLKQELSQVVSPKDIEYRWLEPDINPSPSKLTYDHAITFYLSYLTDLVGNELEEGNHSRYMKRRFTLPWWHTDHRNHAAEILSKRLARAQLLADHFHDRWHEGIPAEEFVRACELASQHESDVMWLVDRKTTAGENSTSQWGGILEPLAAGSSRIWDDEAARDLVLIMDVGAGTTDFSFFLVVQNPARERRQAFPIVPCGAAIKMAGDTLDSYLADLIIQRANLGGDLALRERVSRTLYLSGIRRLKEQLFLTGNLILTLANGQTVSIALGEFLATTGVSGFTDQLRKALKDFFAQVDSSWDRAVGESGITLVLTGGGCSLPMIKSLAAENWLVAGRNASMRLTKELPEFIAQNYDADFAREYPQLAVALGGALPMLIDESRIYHQWMGGAPEPGRLSQYATRGI